MMNDERQLPAPRPDAAKNGGALGKAAAEPGRRHSSARRAASERLVNGRYRLLARLGSGRLGPVYEAADERSSIPGGEGRVAVQLLDSKLITIRRFAGEFECGVKTLEGISHSNIVRLLDAGRDEGHFFLVTEAPDSGSLRFVLDDVGMLPLEEAAAVMRSVGDALQYLHAKAIVHGNLKPENVLLTFDFDVKLLDIVPPEWPAASHGKPDPRSDVHGLACLAYEMLAGKHPFNENTPEEAHRAGLNPAPIEYLSDRQWRALAAGLELEPERRTPTVARFLEDFGITGTERLRGLVSDDADSATPVAPDFDLAPHAAPAPQPVFIPTYAPAAVQSKRPAGARGQFFLLLLVAVGALAYVYRDRLRDPTTQLAAAIDSWTAEDSPGNAGIEAAPPAENAAVATATPADDTQTAVEPPVRPAAEAVPAASAARGPAQFGFAQPVMTVDEDETAVRIVIRRSGDITQSASIAWWSDEGSAIAERDFADLGLRIERFSAGEAARTVFVPLVNDADRERLESFNVYLGRTAGDSRAPGPLAGMRIDIVDDD